MSNKLIGLIGIMGVIGIIGVIWGPPAHKATEGATVETAAPAIKPTPEFAEPAADFKARVTKKPFGINITPGNSPISPERFFGYHTGADAEYTDIVTDVTVHSIADGEIVTARRASGYGGVIVLKFQLNGQDMYAIYGHVRPAGMKAAGTKVIRGEKIAVLGTGYSTETDGERRHLHLGIANKNTITGYVASEAELKATWRDPTLMF
jgi:murein DD-endopeptidase MepM/ murein hydrolase activator NlpD